MKLFKKITIVGVGLLGGSIGLAIKKNKIADEITGYFRHSNKISEAVKKGCVDSGTNNLLLAVSEADLIILCSPVCDIEQKLKELKKLPTSKAIITDVGSTKAKIVQAGHGLNFVGSHPLAGSEQSGIDTSRPDLFKKSICILTPTNKTNKQALAKIKKFWEILGANTTLLTPEKHDLILGATSHLPHIIAFALINTIPQSSFKLSAGGLKDTTRIALSNPKVWNDIFLSNKKEIIKMISKFEKNINSIKTALIKNDSNKLISLLSQANKKRKML